MRVLLQHKPSGYYVRADGDLTGDAAEANDFLSSAQAIDYCTAHKLHGFQMVLKFDEQQYDIVLPMVAGRRRSLAGG